MIKRLALGGIALLGVIVALPPDGPVFADAVIAQVASTPTPPIFIPAWILGGGNFYGGQQAGVSPCPSTGCAFNDVDPGATPDQHLFAGVIDASSVTDAGLPTNCPGIGSGGSNISNCNPYKYINMSVLLCDGGLESTNAFNYLNGSDETGFLHTYTAPPNTPSPAPANRITVPGNCASPIPSPGPSNGFPTNPGDSSFQNWLVNHAWQTSADHFPSPYGILEDNFSVIGWPCSPSYEYGDARCNARGNSASPAPHDWETALGDFESNAEKNCPNTCFAFIGNGLTPGGGSDTGPCDNIAGGHCFVSGAGGVVDDTDAIAKLCSNADSGGNLQGIEAEEIVFLKGNTNTGTPAYADTQTIVYMINTMSQLVQNTTAGCKNTVAIDIEASGGSFYPLNNYTPGTVSGGIPIRAEATALRFLVPDPSTLIPDRIQPLYYTVGGTNNHWSPSADECTTSPYCEVPYFFEETLVPQGPEVAVGAFSWNGSTQSVGDGCPSNHGDSGGAVDLVAVCVGDDGSAVFRQEYHHLYVAGMDYGPVAILLNTSSDMSLPIVSSWFTCTGCDPLSSFNYRLTLSGGELQSVFYNSAGNTISLPCTQSTYCTGSNSVTGNTTRIGPTGPGYIAPHAGVILLGSN